MLCIDTWILSLSSEELPRIALNLLAYHPLESNALFRPAAVDGMDRVRRLMWEQWRRNNLFPSDNLCQLGHLPQVIELSRRHCLEPGVPFRGIKSH